MAKPDRSHAPFEGDLLKLSTPQSLDPIDGKMSVRTMTCKKLK
jgi:hypothetical protein